MAEAQLRVMVIDTNPVRAAAIEKGLLDGGCTDVEIATEMDGLVARIEAMAPDIVVVDLGNPNRDRLENILQLVRAIRKPFAMFVDESDRQNMEDAIAAGVSAYVVDGFHPDRICAIMDVAISRFNAFARLEKELASTRSALRDRDTIDKAKRLLMDTRKLSEEDAYTLMRKTAMNQNRRIADVARSLLDSAALLTGLPGGD